MQVDKITNWGDNFKEYIFLYSVIELGNVENCAMQSITVTLKQNKHSYVLTAHAMHMCQFSGWNTHHWI